MRNIDVNRAQNYIKKHKRHKEWIAFALCLSLLTGTFTLYGLNKPATALTDEGAPAVGVILETADSEFEQELIEETLENAQAGSSEQDSASEASAAGSSAESSDSEEDDSQQEVAFVPLDNSELLGNTGLLSENVREEAIAGSLLENSKVVMGETRDAFKQQESMELNPNWITDVSVYLEPTEIWENGKVVDYDTSGAQKITSGQTIPNNSLVYFGVDYTIPTQSMVDQNGNIITDTLTFNIADKIKIDPNGDQYKVIEADIYRKSNRTEKIGTIAIQNGVAIIKFDEDFIRENQRQDIEADFFFAGKVNKSSENTEEDITFYFNDKIKFDVRVKDQKEYGFELTKSNTKVNDSQVDYTININNVKKDGSGGPITIKDVFSFSSEEAGRTFNSSLQLREINVYKNGVFVQKISNFTADGYEGTLPELKQGEEYTITYSYDISNSGFDGMEQDTKVTNKVTASTENFGNKEATSEFTIEGTKTKETPDIKKEFVSIDKNNKTVTWKIVINEKKANLHGYTLRDILKTHNGYGDDVYTSFKGTATISPSYNGQSTITLDGENGFTFNGWSGNNETYTITIVTPYDDYSLGYDNKLYNRATLDDGDHHSESSAEATVEKEVEYGNRVEKTAEEYTYSDRNAIIRWNIKAIKDIKCEMTDEQGRKYWFYGDEIKGNQVITDEQLKALETSLKNAGYDVKIETGDMVYLTARDVVGYRRFGIYFYRDVQEGFTFSYETTGSTRYGSEEVTFSNESFVYSKTIGSSSDQVKYEPMLSKYDGNMNSLGTYNYNDAYLEGDGILTWIIKLVIPGDERAQYGTLTIKEHLPDSVTALGDDQGGLVVATSPDMADAVSFTGGTASIAGATFTHDAATNEIRLDGDSIRGKTLYFRVKARINDDEFDGEQWKSGGSRKTFENKAVIIDKDGGEIQWASATTEVNLLDDYVEKAQLVLNDKNMRQQSVEYTVEINKDAEDLLPGGDVLTLKDTLRAGYKEACFEARLVTDSIKVYEIDNETNQETYLSPDEYTITYSETEVTHAPGNEWALSYVMYCNLEFKLPDKKHIKIVYTYDFTRLEQEGNQTSVYNYGSIHVNNIAVLEGISKSGISDEQSTEITVYRTGATADTVGTNFYKVDAMDVSRYLAGGKFTLWKYEKGSSPQKDGYGDIDYKPVYLKDCGDDVYAPAESGSNEFTTTDGSCSFTKIETDVAYRIVEETAPEGYKKGLPIYFVYESAIGSEKKCPDNFEAKGGMVLSPHSDVVLTNKRNETTSLTVKKEWINADGTKAPITFKLARRRSHIASTYNYYKLDVYYKHNNAIESYRGYPSVREGSTLTYNIPNYKYAETRVTINGNTKVYRGLNDNETPVIIEGLTQDITSDTTVIIELNNGQGPAYTLSTQIRSSDTVEDETVDDYTEEFQDVYQLSDENGWKKTFDKLEKSYEIEEDGVKKSYDWLYYVTEVSANGFYDVSYTDNNIHGTNTGTITITNTRNDLEAYTLPKTGGPGDTPVKVLGIVMMCIAIITFKKTRFKGEEKNERN